MIHRLTENDRDVYIEMAREFYHSDAVLHPIPDEYFVRTVEEAVRSDAYAEIFLFECGGETAGYGLTAKTFSQEAGGYVWWIEEVYIREKFRSRGLGREFFPLSGRAEGKRSYPSASGGGEGEYKSCVPL